MTLKKKLVRDIKKNKYKYLIILPVIIYLILFCYKPMYGIVIAFQRFRPNLGIAGSKWVGLNNFKRFFSDPSFFRVLKNTFSISFLSIIFSFPMPIILALLLNEVKVSWFKRSVQTVTYMPHFISMVVMCGLVSSFCQTNGVFNDIIVFFGGERTNLLLNSKLFYPIYILSDIWQEVGWGSIIYLSAISGIDQEQYEAAKIDGANRIQQLLYITLPGLLPTISMMLVLRLGQVLTVGYEKILLLQNSLNSNVSTVISVFVYQKGLISGDYSYSTAVSLFNSVVNIVFLLAANKMSKKMGQNGLF